QIFLLQPSSSAYTLVSTLAIYRGSQMNLLRMLAYVTGMINQALLLQNEYLVAENRILKGQVKGRLLLSEAEKATLAEIATGWDARSWRKWRPRCNLIRFWAG